MDLSITVSALTLICPGTSCSRLRSSCVSAFAWSQAQPRQSSGEPMSRQHGPCSSRCSKTTRLLRDMLRSSITWSRTRVTRLLEWMLPLTISISFPGRPPTTTHSHFWTGKPRDILAAVPCTTHWTDIARQSCSIQDHSIRLSEVLQDICAIHHVILVNTLSGCFF